MVTPYTYISLYDTELKYHIWVFCEFFAVNILGGYTEGKRWKRCSFHCMEYGKFS